MSEKEKEGMKVQETGDINEEKPVKNNNIKMVPAYKLVKTIDVGIRMIPEDQKIDPDDENDDDSMYEPFNIPLPIPPNCKLFNSPEAKSAKESTVSQEIPIKIQENTKKRLIEPSLPPLNSLNLKENSNNYVYEDAWNVENSRPLIEKVLVKKDDVDRSDWHARVLEKHPCIQELKERIYPLWRAISFGQSFNAGRKDVVDKLDDQIITQLIYQHLRFEGLKETKKKLEEESGLSAKHIDVDQSLIHAHIKEAIKRTENIYDTVIGDKLPPKNRKNKTEILKEIDERLGDIGIEDESTFGGSENTNIDIWDDLKAKENVLIETDPISRISTFRGASLNHLIMRLTDKNVEDYENYLLCFLVTYQSFTTTEILITKLIERAHPPTNVEDTKAEDIKDLVLRVFKILVTDHFSHLNPRILTRLMSYIKDDYEKKSSIKPTTTEFEKLIQISSNPSIPQLLTDPPKPKVNTTSQTKENIFHHELFILDVDEEEIARQLSLIDFELFYVIRSEEFLNRNWDQTKTKHRAPNIIRMIDHFNDISTWITSLIVTCPDLKERRTRLTKCLKLCQHLKEMNSFDSFHAVLTGIFDPALRRLKHTIETLPNNIKEKMEQFRNFFENDKNTNYRSYHDLFKKVKQDVPCIPYLRVSLTDLKFIEDNQPSIVKHNNVNLIHWTKKEAVYEIIKDVQKCQKRPFNFTYVHQIQVLLRSLKEKIERKDLMRHSFKVESAK